MPTYRERYARFIIGKTQVEGLRPTVYYRSDSGTFGRITQGDDILENLGRAPPRKHPLYNLGNTGPNGVLEERYGEDVQHKSRAPIVFVTTEDEREALSEAHRIFVRIKKRSLRRMRMDMAARADLKL